MFPATCPLHFHVLLTKDSKKLILANWLQHSSSGKLIWLLNVIFPHNSSSYSLLWLTTPSFSLLPRHPSYKSEMSSNNVSPHHTIHSQFYLLKLSLISNLVMILFQALIVLSWKSLLNDLQTPIYIPHCHLHKLSKIHIWS